MKKGAHVTNHIDRLDGSVFKANPEQLGALFDIRKPDIDLLVHPARPGHGGFDTGKAVGFSCRAPDRPPTRIVERFIQL